MRGLAFIFGALTALMTGPALARDPLLAIPLDCQLGSDCFIQNYVDHDPGPGAADLTCGPQTYDGHNGTDFSLPSLAAMTAGVRVLAAAPGTVKAVRDGMADVVYTDPGAPDITGHECGNGVLLDHGGGWQTQYCHMKNGSVRVQPGQRVGSGTALGQVGLSGRTQFPHLHLTVRHDGAVVDPFLPSDIVQCGIDPAPGMWKNGMIHVDGGLIAAGITDRIPDYAAVNAGTALADTLPSEAPALVIWAHVFGARTGDELLLTLTGPDGVPVVEETVALDRTQARSFRAVGQRGKGPWPAGRYTGHVTLIRKNAALASRDLSMTVMAADTRAPTVRP